MSTDQIMSAIFLIAVLILILPGFLSTNYKLKEFLRNLSIWAIITLVIIVIIYFISLWEK
jgi:predicted aspartyl protease